MKRFAKFVPATLARIQLGNQVRLRDKNIKPQGSFDLKTQGGKVIPLPVSQKVWTFPNGCSLRSPWSTTFQEVVENFNGKNVRIYTIAEGTPLPNDLMIIYEKGDHFSLQCSKEMSLPELNDKLTEFFSNKGFCMSKEEYQLKYPAGEKNDCLNISALQEN